MAIGPGAQSLQSHKLTSVQIQGLGAARRGQEGRREHQGCRTRLPRARL